MQAGSSTGELAFFFGMRHFGEPLPRCLSCNLASPPRARTTKFTCVLTCICVRAVGARASKRTGAVCLRLPRAQFLPLLKLFPDDEELIARAALTSFDVKSQTARRLRAIPLLSSTCCLPTQSMPERRRLWRPESVLPSVFGSEFALLAPGLSQQALGKHRAAEPRVGQVGQVGEVREVREVVADQEQGHQGVRKGRLRVPRRLRFGLPPATRSLPLTDTSCMD